MRQSKEKFNENHFSRGDRGRASDSTITIGTNRYGEKLVTIGKTGTIIHQIELEKKLVLIFMG